MKTGVELITDERKRQVEEEGYTIQNDCDWQSHGELATAALCYIITDDQMSNYDFDLDLMWPWDWEYYKPCPNDRIRELVKAGALIAAEIDRLQRKNNY